MQIFADRAAAGRELGKLLEHYRAHDQCVVLGLARGGVPVAFEVARYLQVPLDTLIVRKLGAPGQPELALGAIASGGVTVTNEALVRYFPDKDALARVEAHEHRELARRELAYRGNRPALALRGREVILVDDGAATGASMLAAVRATRRLAAERIVVALPVASRDAVEMLQTEADEVICLQTPSRFSAVGEWYEDFSGTTDAEVKELLAQTTA